MVLLILLPILVVLGTWDLGRRLDMRILTLAECLRDDAGCSGEEFFLAYRSIVEVADHSVVIGGRGYRVEILDFPASEPARVGLKVSVIGTWLGGSRIRADRVMVHPYRGVKRKVGLAVLLVWAVLVARFWRRRGDG